MNTIPVIYQKRHQQPSHPTSEVPSTAVGCLGATKQWFVAHGTTTTILCSLLGAMLITTGTALILSGNLIIGSILAGLAAVFLAVAVTACCYVHVRQQRAETAENLELECSAPGSLQIKEHEAHKAELENKERQMQLERQQLQDCRKYLQHLLEEEKTLQKRKNKVLAEAKNLAAHITDFLDKMCEDTPTADTRLQDDRSGCFPRHPMKKMMGKLGRKNHTPVPKKTVPTIVYPFRVGCADDTSAAEEQQPSEKNMHLLLQKQRSLQEKRMLLEQAGAKNRSEILRTQQACDTAEDAVRSHEDQPRRVTQTPPSLTLVHKKNE